MILLALIFWSSMWWLAGAFLAVPLMATINIVCARFKNTRWISILLSKEGQI
jgi:predicted PurR-regulated permease PerM